MKRRDGAGRAGEAEASGGRAGAGSATQATPGIFLSLCQFPPSSPQTSSTSTHLLEHCVAGIGLRRRDGQAKGREGKGGIERNASRGMGEAEWRVCWSRTPRPAWRKGRRRSHVAGAVASRQGRQAAVGAWRCAVAAAAGGCGGRAAAAAGRVAHLHLQHFPSLCTRELHDC